MTTQEQNEVIGLGAFIFPTDGVAQIGDDIALNSTIIRLAVGSSTCLFDMFPVVSGEITAISINSIGMPTSLTVDSVSQVKLEPVLSDYFFNFDGSDETVKLQFLCSSGLTYRLPKGRTLKISSTVSVSNRSEIDGSWCSLIVAGTSRVFNIQDGKISNFDVDGQGQPHHAYPCFFNQGFIGGEIGAMKWRNFHGKISNFQTYPVCVPLLGVYDFKVGDQSFYNIKQDDDGAITGQGFVGGLYLYAVSTDVANYEQSYGVIGDIYGEDIATVDAGLGVVQDSDLVRTYTDFSSADPFNKVKIGNIHAVDVAKRALKVGCEGISFGNVKSENRTLSSPVFAAVEVLGGGSLSKIGKVEIFGNHERGFYCASDNVNAGDVYDYYGCSVGAVLLGGPGGTAEQSKCGDVYGLMATRRGVAVYFYAADNCSVGQISGNHSKAINTNTTNLGLTSSVSRLIAHGVIEVKENSGTIVVDSWQSDYSKAEIGIVTFAQISGEFRCPNVDVKIDGRIALYIFGMSPKVYVSGVIRRVSSTNGNPVSFSVVSSNGATGGELRGELDVIVDKTVSGSPTGTAAKTLCYLTGLQINMTRLVVEVNDTVRGATGYPLWLNCDGVVSFVSVFCAFSSINIQLAGNINVGLLEHRINSSSLVCNSGVGLFLYAVRPSSTYTGLTIAPSTRPALR